MVFIALNIMFSMLFANFKVLGNISGMDDSFFILFLQIQWHRSGECISGLVFSNFNEEKANDTADKLPPGERGSTDADSSNNLSELSDKISFNEHQYEYEGNYMSESVTQFPKLIKSKESR